MRQSGLSGHDTIADNTNPLQKSAMRFQVMIVCSLAFSLTACSQMPDERQEIEDRIESEVTLPGEALALARYERYYAIRADGSVIGSYIVHDKDYHALVAVACKQVSGAPFPCPIDGGGVRLVAPGERLWLDDAGDLPFMNGGGCAQVTIEFLPKSGKFTRVECNGPY